MICAIAITLGISSTIRYNRREIDRVEKLNIFSESNGFEYIHSSEHLESQLGDSGFLHIASRFSEVILADLDGADVFIFDRNNEDILKTIIYFKSEGLVLPDFKLMPATTSQRLLNFLDPQDIC